jgi:hypothetical protein
VVGVNSQQLPRKYLVWPIVNQTPLSLMNERDTVNIIDMSQFPGKVSRLMEYAVGAWGFTR